MTVVSAAVAKVAALDLILVVAEVATGLHSVVWPNWLNRPGDGMAVVTAICFLLASISPMQPALDFRSANSLFVGTSTVGLVLSSIARVAYALDTEALY